MEDSNIYSDIKLLTTKETSKLLSIKVATLKKWRLEDKKMLPFLKINRLVRYRASDIKEFIKKADKQF